MHCTLYIAQLHVVLLDNVQAQSLSMRLVNFYICGYEYLCILNFLYSVQYTYSKYSYRRWFTNTVLSCKDNRDWWPTSVYCGATTGGRIFCQTRLSTCCSLPCMYIVQVVCTRHRLLPDVLVACVEASMTSQMCR